MKNCNILLWTVIVLLSMSFLCGCIAKNGDTPALFDAKKDTFIDLSYGTAARHRLDVLLPAPLDELHTAIPAFVLIHGGSWTGGDKSHFHYLRPLLNSYGYAAICINYRLIGDGAIYTDMLSDITAALEYIKNNGKELKICTDKIALWGNSAGGHLALLKSYRDAVTSPIPIAMVISQVGPTDFADPSYYNADPNTLDYRLNLVSKLTGANINSADVQEGNFPTQILDASPITFVDKAVTPTLLAYGEKDDIVPYTNATRLYDKLVLSGTPVQLISYPNSGHDLANDPDKNDEALSVLAQAAAIYFPPNT